MKITNLNRYEVPFKMKDAHWEEIASFEIEIETQEGRIQWRGWSVRVENGVQYLQGPILKCISRASFKSGAAILYHAPTPSAFLTNLVALLKKEGFDIHPPPRLKKRCGQKKPEKEPTKFKSVDELRKFTEQAQKEIDRLKNRSANISVPRNRPRR